MTDNVRGWWRRFSAKNEPTWDLNELRRMNDEAEAVRRRNRRVVRPQRRRAALRAGEAES